MDYFASIPLPLELSQRVLNFVPTGPPFLHSKITGGEIRLKRVQNTELAAVAEYACERIQRMYLDVASLYPIAIHPSLDPTMMDDFEGVEAWYNSHTASD